jgi:hypothetical protein
VTPRVPHVPSIGPVGYDDSNVIAIFCFDLLNWDLFVCLFVFFF